LSEKPTQKGESSITKVEKPWGYELIWASTHQYVANILFVRAGEGLSLQYHRIKEETLFLESGECLLEAGTDEENLQPVPFPPGCAFHVPPGCIHRLTAKSDCRIFEVSTPQLGDVVRLKDRYGRG
jgi:mannose-6-phosphate isomerase-like protein (cupin superfamily)